MGSYSNQRYSTIRNAGFTNTNFDDIRFGGPKITVSETAPGAPAIGEIWFDPSVGETFVYYNDGDSSQWISVTPSTVGPQGNPGVDAQLAVYTNSAALPSQATQGDFAYVTDIQTFYIFNGGVWVASGSIGAVIPSVSSVSPNSYDGDDEFTFTITGTNFTVGTAVDFITQSGSIHRATTTTVVTQGELSAVTPVAFTKADGPLSVRVTTGEGIVVNLNDSIQTGEVPNWVTGTGTLLTVNKDQQINFQLEATDPEGQFITYSIISGSLPPDITLDQGSGIISGQLDRTNPAFSNGDVTYSFTAGATDTAGNLTTRTFSINVADQISTFFNKIDTFKWTYENDIGQVSDLISGLDSTFLEGIESDANTINPNLTVDQTHSYGTYVKFNMLVGINAVQKECIGFLNKNSTNGEWVLSALDFGDHALVDDRHKNLRWINSRNTVPLLADYTSTGANWNTSGQVRMNIGNDDNDNSFLRADGNLILNWSNATTYSSSSNYVYRGDFNYNGVWSNAANSGRSTGLNDTPIFANVTSLTSAPYWSSVENRVSSYGSTASFLGIQGEVHFRFDNDTYYVSVILPDGTLYRFQPQTLSGLTAYSGVDSNLFANGSNGGNSSRVFLTDGFGQGIFARSGYNQAMYFEVDWTTGRLVNTVAVTGTYSRYNPTEEDIFGDNIHTVNGQRFVQRDGSMYHTNGMVNGTGEIDSDHANWKSDYNITTTNLQGLVQFNNASQQGMDVLAMVGQSNYLYFGDWGHDNGGIFNVGNDTYFTMQRSNVRLIPNDWY